MVVLLGKFGVHTTGKQSDLKAAVFSFMTQNKDSMLMFLLLNQTLSKTLEYFLAHVSEACLRGYVKGFMAYSLFPKTDSLL